MQTFPVSNEQQHKNEHAELHWGVEVVFPIKSPRLPHTAQVLAMNARIQGAECVPKKERGGESNKKKTRDSCLKSNVATQI